MDIAKLAWQAQIAKRHFDRRTIAVPESMKGGNRLLFDHWECSQIMAVVIEEDTAKLYYPSINNPSERGGAYNVPLDLLTLGDRAIVESLAKERPITWF